MVSERAFDLTYCRFMLIAIHLLLLKGALRGKRPQNFQEHHQLMKYFNDTFEVADITEDCSSHANYHEKGIKRELSANCVAKYFHFKNFSRFEVWISAEFLFSLSSCYLPRSEEIIEFSERNMRKIHELIVFKLFERKILFHNVRFRWNYSMFRRERGKTLKLLINWEI